MQFTFIQRFFKELVHFGLFLRDCKIVFGWSRYNWSSFGCLRLEGFSARS